MKKNILHIGSLWTITDFKQSDGSTVRIKVTFDKECTISNHLITYSFSLYTKGYRCRNFNLIFIGEKTLDPRFKEFITEQELYEAFNNHWNKLNPYKIFNNGQVNGKLVDFRVRQIEPEETFYTY